MRLPVSNVTVHPADPTGPFVAIGTTETTRVSKRMIS
jgi:hypothetical protein